MSPHAISTIARGAFPEVAWKPPWRSGPALPARLACRPIAARNLPRKVAEIPAPARPAHARAPPPAPFLLCGPVVDT